MVISGNVSAYLAYALGVKTVRDSEVKKVQQFCMLFQVVSLIWLGEGLSASLTGSVDLRASVSLGLLSSSTLLQLRGELMSDDRSPFFSGGGCRPETGRGKFIML